MNNEIQEIRYQVGEAWKGTYNAGTTYGNANVVQDPTGLSVYRSLKPGNVGHPLTDTAWWFLIIDLSSIKEESDRIKALNDAIAADEAQRVENENGRVTAEQVRVDAENARVTAEQGRVTAEQQRVLAEQQRASQEQTRISQEQSRVTAEQGRVAAEAQRVQKEQLRENNEAQRVINETNRVAAEAERVAQYAADHQQAVADHDQYVDSLGAFDISSYHATGGVLAKYADLTAALGTNGANIPEGIRKGGMSVKFVQSSDNKYVQYRLMAQTFSTTESDWQGVDKVPTSGSRNLVESGGVYDELDRIDTQINGDEPFTATFEQETVEGVAQTIKNNISIPYNGTYKVKYTGTSYPTNASLRFYDKATGSVTLHITLNNEVEQVIELLTSYSKVSLSASSENTHTGTATLFIENVPQGLVVEIEKNTEDIAEIQDKIGNVPTGQNLVGIIEENKNLLEDSLDEVQSDIETLDVQINGEPSYSESFNFTTTAGTSDKTKLEITLPRNGTYKVKYTGTSYPTVATCSFLSRATGGVVTNVSLTPDVESEVILSASEISKVKLFASSANTYTGTATLIVTLVSSCTGIVSQISDLEDDVKRLSNSFTKNDIYNVTFQTVGAETISGLNIPANIPFKIRIDSDFSYTRLDIFKGTTTSTANRLVESAVSGNEYVILSDTQVSAITLYLRESDNFGDLKLTVISEGEIKQSIAIKNNITADSYLAKKFLEEYSSLYDFVSTDLNGYTLVGNDLTYELSVDVKFRNNVTYNVHTTANTLGFFRFKYSGINIEGVEFFEIPVYISDVSKITSLYCGLTSPDNTYMLQASGALHNGWNMIRFATTQLSRSVFSSRYTTLNEFRIYVETSEDATIIVSIPSSIIPPKAKIIFVDDHGYHDFMTTAYPDLKALGVPCTWACQPGRLGAAVEGAGTLLTQADVELLANDSYSEFSWHTYNSSMEQEMSALDLRNMFQSAVTALRKLDVLPQFYWRAAWKQNNAINAMACSDMAEAFATWNSNSGCESIPFNDRYNIKRQTIHGQSETLIANMFRQLKATHGIYVFYTHSIIAEMEEGLDAHITQAMWNIFISYLTTAINEGWLEGTTFNALRVKYGTDIFSK